MLTEREKKYRLSLGWKLVFLCFIYISVPNYNFVYALKNDILDTESKHMLYLEIQMKLIHSNFSLRSNGGKPSPLSIIDSTSELVLHRLFLWYSVEN